jgi:hypothetical protein
MPLRRLERSQQEAFFVFPARLAVLRGLGPPNALGKGN